ncbi:MAG: acyl carrier protein [Armatimonadetes bacterium]|nr:acyl carrier protein [Armatimonadota bacterium]
MEDRIKNVMSAVFEIPADSIDDDSSPESIESWDSLKHMNLVVTLEEEFDITLNDDEIFEMINYPFIKLIIAKYSGQL